MEHPVDAAARGTHRGPPVARAPSPGFTWAVRVTLLVPLAVAGAVGVPDLLASPPRGGDTVVAGVLALVLVISVVLAWWSARWPRLAAGDMDQVRAQLGRKRYRRVRRVVWSRAPLPDRLNQLDGPLADLAPGSPDVPDQAGTDARMNNGGDDGGDDAGGDTGGEVLRPWVEAYVYRQLAGAPLAGLLYALNAVNLLHSFTPAPGAPPGSTVGVFGTVLVAFFLLTTLAGAGAVIWLHGRVRAAAHPAALA